MVATHQGDVDAAFADLEHLLSAERPVPVTDGNDARRKGYAYIGCRVYKGVRVTWASANTCRSAPGRRAMQRPQMPCGVGSTICTVSSAHAFQDGAFQDGACKELRRALMLPLSVLGIVPDATAAAAAAATAVADAAATAAAAAAAAAVAPMARLRLALPTGSPFAGGTPVTIQFRWERSTNLTGSEPPACRFGQVNTAAQLLGDSTLLTTPAAFGTLPAQSLLCHAPACTSPRCLPQGKVNTVRRLP